MDQHTTGICVNTRIKLDQVIFHTSFRDRAGGGDVCQRLGPDHLGDDSAGRGGGAAGPLPCRAGVSGRAGRRRGRPPAAITLV